MEEAKGYREEDYDDGLPIYYDATSDSEADREIDECYGEDCHCEEGTDHSYEIIVEIGNSNIKFHVDATYRKHPGDWDIVETLEYTKTSISLKKFNEKWFFDNILPTTILPYLEDDSESEGHVKVFIFSVNKTKFLTSIFDRFNIKWKLITTSKILETLKNKKSSISFPTELGVDRALKCLFVMSHTTLDRYRYSFYGDHQPLEHTVRPPYDDIVGAQPSPHIYYDHKYFDSDYIVTVDLGTATVIEFFKERKWIGGTISIGIKSQLLALKKSCNKLKKFDLKKTLQGKKWNLLESLSTLEGELYTGAVYNTALYLTGLIKQTKETLKIPKTVGTTLFITGGNARYFKFDQQEYRELFKEFDLFVDKTGYLNLDTAEYFINHS